MPLPERNLISRIARLAGQGPREGSVITGIGDDCAVLRFHPGEDVLVTTDFSLEGVHFRREWHPAEAVGHRCLARGLSDIAAMGGEPVAAFLSLALPAKLSQAWVDRFMAGFLQLADEFGVRLAGGDTAQSLSGVLADIVVIGSVPKGKAVLRSGARPGDRIYITGALGGSAAILTQLFSQRTKINSKKLSNYFFPTPRFHVGRFLRKRGVPTAMIDTSDGLSTDLSHICDQSKVGAEIWAAAIPKARIGPRQTEVGIEFALHGGEDYELLFTAPARIRVPAQIRGVPIRCIGEITAGKQMFLIDENGSRSRLRPHGWEHFRHSAKR